MKIVVDAVVSHLDSSTPVFRTNGLISLAPEILDVSGLQLSLSEGLAIGWRELLAHSPGEAYTQWLMDLGLERPSLLMLI